MGGAKGEYPLLVPGHGHKAPLAAHCLASAQQKRRNAAPLDDAEHRFRHLFAQAIEFLAFSVATDRLSPRPAWVPRRRHGSKSRPMAISLSWSGWSFAVMKRNAKESSLARSSLRLENTPVA